MARMGMIPELTPLTKAEKAALDRRLAAAEIEVREHFDTAERLARQYSFAAQWSKYGQLIPRAMAEALAATERQFTRTRVYYQLALKDWPA